MSWCRQVSDIVGHFRWGPFLPVQPDDSLLTLLLLLARYRLKNVPVVVSGQPEVVNIVTQASVVEVLRGCGGMEWFDRVADKRLDQLGLPSMKPEDVIKVGKEPGNFLVCYRWQSQKRGGGMGRREMKVGGCGGVMTALDGVYRL